MTKSEPAPYWELAYTVLSKRQSPKRPHTGNWPTGRKAVTSEAEASVGPLETNLRLEGSVSSEAETSVSRTANYPDKIPEMLKNDKVQIGPLHHQRELGSSGGWLGLGAGRGWIPGLQPIPKRAPTSPTGRRLPR